MPDFISDDGVRLHYVAQGDGAQSIIWLHWMGGEATYWAGLWNRLEAGRYRHAALDFRGHGKSDPRPSAFTAERLARDVLQLVDMLGLKCFVVAGHSFGGKIALKVAALAPSRVAGLLLLGAVGPGKVPLEREALEPIFSRSGDVAFIRECFRPWFTAWPCAELDRALENLARTPNWALRAVAETASWTDLTGEITTLTQPTLIVAGKNDPVYGPDEFLVAPDAVRGAFAERQLEHVHQAAGAEAGRFFSGCDDLGGEGLGRAPGRVVRAAGVVGERIVAGLPAAEPEAHGDARAFVAARGRPQAVGLGVAHDFMAERELVLADAVHGAVGSQAGVGLGLHGSASPHGAPGSHFSFSAEGGNGQALSSPPVAVFSSHLAPRFPNTRSSIILVLGFDSGWPGSGCPWVCLYFAGPPIDLSPRNIHGPPSVPIEMPEPDSKKSRRPLKTVPPERFQPKMLIFWLVLVAAVLALLYGTNSMSTPPENLTIQDVIERAEAKNIAVDANQPAVIRPDLGGGRDGHTITGKSRKDEASPFKPFRAAGRVTDENMMRLQKSKGFVEQPAQTALTAILVNVIPFVVVIALVYFLFVRQLRQAGRGALSFGKSRAKLLTRDRDKLTFADVAGCDEAKEEVSEVVEFLKDPKKFTKMGGRIPKGILMVGPPGTGKTLLAKAVAGEADVPFFSISGSDFVEMFVGVGASRVRDMFEQGRKSAPCLIFIDEIDAVGRQRGAGVGGGNDEREQTLNSLLVEMDGFDTNEGVIIIAATNRPDVLDSALLRPGRFDRQVYVDLPDLNGREQILRVHAKKVSLAENVDLSVIARGTPGLSGADLSNLLNEAALLAARRNKKKVEMIDVEDAREKVQFGRERRRLMDDEEKKLTAYHEAGHALVTAVLDDGYLPVHKVTIIPRGGSLGSTMYIPKKDMLTQEKKKLEIRIATGCAGRIAEEIVLNDISNGAAGDIRQVTKIARHMVCDWGMSPLGMIAYGESNDTVFLGREITRNQAYSEETARRIDAEVFRIVDEQYNRAKELVLKHRVVLDKIAAALLEFETIEGKHVLEILEFGEMRSPVLPSVPPKIESAAPEKKPAEKSTTASGSIGPGAHAPNPA